jgi:hypothetical protein
MNDTKPEKQLTPSEERKAAKRAEARAERAAAAEARRQKREQLRAEALSAQKPLDELWTAQECAKFLNVQTATWFAYVNRPMKSNPAPLPLPKVGWSPLWDPEEVREFAKNRPRPIKS